MTTIESAIAAAASSYLSAEAAAASIVGTSREQAMRVRRALTVCASPAGRFGLDSVSADVVAVYTDARDRLAATAAPILSAIDMAMARGLTADEASTQGVYGSSSFAPGDYALMTWLVR